MRLSRRDPPPTIRKSAIHARITTPRTLIAAQNQEGDVVYRQTENARSWPVTDSLVISPNHPGLLPRRLLRRQ